MKRKLISLILTATTLAVLLTGCDLGGTSSAGTASTVGTATTDAASGSTDPATGTVKDAENDAVAITSDFSIVGTSTGTAAATTASEPQTEQPQETDAPASEKEETTAATDAPETEATQSDTTVAETEAAQSNTTAAETEPAGSDPEYSIDGTTDGVTVEGNVYTITAAGTYTLSGKLNGRIVVSVPDDGEVTLLLSGASITSSENAVIWATEAGKLTVKSDEGTYNEISDLRAQKTEDDDGQGAGAITAACDLNITGKGSLVVTGSYNNGIHTKDDLKIKNVTLKVTAPNNALKGNDSVTVESGNLILISTGGDGIKTENTDVSSKGNQRGTVALEGGSIEIYAACDGIDASYDATVANGVTLTIKTATYSSYSGEVVASSTTESYLIVPTSAYSSSWRFAAYYEKDGADEGVWADAAYDTTVRSGRTQYYALKLSAPSGYTRVTYYRFASGSANALTGYDAKTDRITVNTSMNAYLIRSLSNGSASGDWVTLTTGGGGGPGGPGGQGNKEKTTYSSKGIKAGNNVLIAGGTVSISAMDDGLHANYGDTLENGSVSQGNVTITGGSVEIISADDGIHADNVLSIEGGTVAVAKSYEGLEGNTVNIKGGTIAVKASDDGVNASSGPASPSVNVSGGTLSVTTSSGDTDGIDSNGKYTQTGGFVLIMGGNSSGNVAGSLDTDDTVSVTGGTIVALGGICELPGSSSSPVVKMQRKSFSAGSYVLKNASGDAVASFTLPSSYTSCWICSDGFTVGGSYTLVKDGSTFASWTQSSQSVSVN